MLLKNNLFARDMKMNLGHNLTAVDLRKNCNFDKHWEEQGEFDKDLNEYAKVTNI